MDIDDSGPSTTAVSGPVEGGAKPVQARKQFEGDAVNQTDNIASTCSGSNIGAQVKSPVSLVMVLPHSDLLSSISPQVEPLFSTIIPTPTVPAQSAPVMVSATPTNMTDGDTGIPFLTESIVAYLRSVSPAEKWQTLVMWYITFEKGGPPIGV